MCALSTNRKSIAYEQKSLFMHTMVLTISEYSISHVGFNKGRCDAWSWGGGGCEQEYL